MSTELEVFEQAAGAAKSLPERPDDATMLQLYALYKQGSVGDVQGEKPGFFDFVGAAKYEAWSKLARGHARLGQDAEAERATRQWQQALERVGRPLNDAASDRGGTS